MSRHRVGLRVVVFDQNRAIAAGIECLGYIGVVIIPTVDGKQHRIPLSRMRGRVQQDLVIACRRRRRHTAIDRPNNQRCSVVRRKRHGLGREEQRIGRVGGVHIHGRGHEPRRRNHHIVVSGMVGKDQRRAYPRGIGAAPCRIHRGRAYRCIPHPFVGNDISIDIRDLRGNGRAGTGRSHSTECRPGGQNGRDIRGDRGIPYTAGYAHRGGSDGGRV